MAYKNYEDQLASQRRWRARQKDGYFYLYYLPEEHYVGISNYVKGRMYDHSKKGKITEGYEIIAKFKRGVDAHLLETMFHQRGYNGYNYGAV